MTQDSKHNDAGLDGLLARATATVPDIPDGLEARVLGDALRVQAERAEPLRLRRQSALSRILSSIGGWPAAGGLAAATCAGFWLGVSPPDGLPDAGSLILGGDVVAGYDDSAELSGFGWVPEEG